MAGKKNVSVALGLAFNMLLFTLVACQQQCSLQTSDLQVCTAVLNNPSLAGQILRTVSTITQGQGLNNPLAGLNLGTVTQCCSLLNGTSVDGTCVCNVLKVALNTGVLGTINIGTPAAAFKSLVNTCNATSLLSFRCS